MVFLFLAKRNFSFTVNDIKRELFVIFNGEIVEGDLIVMDQDEEALDLVNLDEFGALAAPSSPALSIGSGLSTGSAYDSPPSPALSTESGLSSEIGSQEALENVTDALTDLMTTEEALEYATEELTDALETWMSTVRRIRANGNGVDRAGELDHIAARVEMLDGLVDHLMSILYTRGADETVVFHARDEISRTPSPVAAPATPPPPAVQPSVYQVAGDPEDVVAADDAEELCVVCMVHIPRVQYHQCSHKVICGTCHIRQIAINPSYLCPICRAVA